MRLLVIEDELPMRTALVETLSAEGYRVRSAENGEEGLEIACTETFDLVLLDVMMPVLDGFSVCRELRKRGRLFPILMLTAKGQVDDRVEGLDNGADDYLVKPFSLRELLARVRALLRRHEQKSAVPETVQLGSVTLDFKKQIVHRSGAELPLSDKEAGMLRLLAAHPDEPVSRERFLDVVWGYNAYPSTRTVDNFIAALRTKIEADPAAPRHLITVRGTGYRLVP
ncbi:response regulator transcription factor [Luteolibacter ambystomatis]|uniref:Response regulator transcription factor n=1 Tax=Luteolibacter ambystomatis TaxID=2824561 RepID=A0A975G6L6_9BACT|nr:response regulator transcription factor [Luteolibacter ambystomatis]QUE49721.1 response regulator transcription factor [Luteolibacter ambystomatis]